MQVRHVWQCTRRVCTMVLGGLLCCAFVVTVNASDEIRWEDNQGKEHSIEVQEAAPQEQLKSGQGADAITETAPDAEKLERKYEDIRTEEAKKQAQEQQKQEAASLDDEISRVDAERQDVEREISVLKQRRGWSRGQVEKRQRISMQIVELEKKLDQLNQQKKSLQDQKDALGQ